MGKNIGTKEEMKYTENKARAYKVDLNGLTVIDRLANLLKNAIKKMLEAVAKAFQKMADSINMSARMMTPIVSYRDACVIRGLAV